MTETKIDSCKTSPPREIPALWSANGDFSSARASDISRTGAFIRTTRPPSLETVIGLRLVVPGGEIRAQAIVRRSLTGTGMGVEFGAMPVEDRARLEALVLESEADLVSKVTDSPKPPTQDAPAQAFPTLPLPEGSTRQTKKSRATSRLSGGPERRSRTRYKFSAAAEMRMAGCEAVIGQLINLGTGGCYINLAEPFPPGEMVDVTVNHNNQFFHAQATVKSLKPGVGMGLLFAEIEPKEQLVLDEWLTAAMERAWLASNRRRSHRVMVSMPVHVEAKDSVGERILEETTTISVSAHGALLPLEMKLNKGQTVTLRNPSTNDSLECSVDYLGSERKGRREVGVSFVQPNRTLWQIAFPPGDWSPAHPYAKGGRPARAAEAEGSSDAADRETVRTDRG